MIEICLRPSQKALKEVAYVSWEWGWGTIAEDEKETEDDTEEGKDTRWNSDDFCDQFTSTFMDTNIANPVQDDD